jgi:hypothetical protein
MSEAHDARWIEQPVRVVTGHAALLEPLWARPSLAVIRDHARAHGLYVGPLIATVLVRHAARVPYNVVLPKVRRVGSLNVLVAVPGEPGRGKGATFDEAAELITSDDGFEELRSGTDSGVLKAFYRPGEDRHSPPERRLWQALVRTDEARTIAGLRDNLGNFLAMMCSAWSGEALGGNYSRQENRGYTLAAHSYRIVALFSAQPRHLAWLLGDAESGTPQRFLFSAFDDDDPPLPPRERPRCEHLVMAAPWKLDVPGAGRFVLGADDRIVAEIADTLFAQSIAEPGALDPLDAHRTLNRFKVAGLLATLDSRLRITLDDWTLAEAVMRYSDACRAALIASLRAIRVAEQRARDERAAATALHVDDRLARSARDSAGRSAARVVWRHYASDEHDGDGCPRRCLNQAVASKHRERVSVDEYVAEAVHRGWLRRDGDDRYKPGDEQP